jgi:hypothetical protein
LDWYAEQAKGANDALFMTFAFGMNQRFQDAYRTGSAKLRYALMEAMSGPTRTKEKRLANEAAIIALKRMRENKFAIGSRLGMGAFNHWLAEQLSGLNVHEISAYKIHARRSFGRESARGFRLGELQ